MSKFPMLPYHILLIKEKQYFGLYFKWLGPIHVFKSLVGSSVDKFLDSEKPFEI